jgi:exopolysaccharide biosynthesis polyprenyl glycosylphosphotransferase
MSLNDLTLTGSTPASGNVITRTELSGAIAETPQVGAPPSGALEAAPIGRALRPNQVLVARVAVDVIMLAAASLILVLLATVEEVTLAPAPWLVLYPLLVLGLFKVRGMYASRLRLQVLDEVRQVVAISALVAMFLFTIRAVLTDEAFLAAQGVREWLLASLFLCCGRVGLAWALRRAWTQGELVRPTLIVGAGHVGHLVAKRLLEHPECGLKPVGYLDKQPLEDDVERVSGIPVLGASWDLDRAIAEYGVQHVVISFSTAPHQVLLGIVRRCDELGITVSFVPRLFEKVTSRLTVEHLGSLPLLTVSRSDPKGWQFSLKYGSDRLLAAVGLLVCAPVLAVAALAILVTMGRPILYRQARVGLDGKTFEIVKFRSMQPASPEDASAGPDADAGESERLTRLGRLLRLTSVDELPQLVNVLRGDMSLIGPRPERPEFAQIFEGYIHRYGDRHRVKSGITGWAQVHGIGRGADRFSKEALGDRVEWDNYYIENWSLWLDLKIVLMTIAAVLHFGQTS